VENKSGALCVRIQFKNVCYVLDRYASFGVAIVGPMFASQALRSHGAGGRSGGVQLRVPEPGSVRVRTGEIKIPAHRLHFGNTVEAAGVAVGWAEQVGSVAVERRVSALSGSSEEG
jgi:hypothetical protein